MQGESVVANGETPPLLVLVEAAFDDVATLVVLNVVGDQAAAFGTATQAMSLLVRWFGYDRGDATRS